MIGELIPTGVTFGVGRNSINDAFSGTAYMNNIELDSGGNFSGGIGGGIISSGGTDLYNIFCTATATTSGGVESYVNIGSAGTSFTWNVSGDSTNYEVTLTGATTTLYLTGVRNGEYGTIIVNQDAVGGRTITLGTVNGADATHKVVNGGGGFITLTSTATAIDILTFTYNGSVMYWTVGNDYT